MSSSPHSTPEQEPARLLAEARQALRQQQEAASASVHLAQAILQAYQRTTSIAQHAFEQIPNEESREHFATQMTKVTRALAGVVEEFSPGLTPDAMEDLPVPSIPTPLPEEFFLWLRTCKGGATLARADAITAGRSLWHRASAQDREMLLRAWRQGLRARAQELLHLAAGHYAL
jgi:hypothetical protein